MTSANLKDNPTLDITVDISDSSFPESSDSCGDVMVVSLQNNKNTGYQMEVDLYLGGEGVWGALEDINWVNLMGPSSVGQIYILQIKRPDVVMKHRLG